MLYNYDREICKTAGYQNIAGVDEAGRGPLAGPVCAAAVILPLDYEIEGLNDSKKLTAKKRELLYDEIIEHALSYSIATATHEEIDDINILQATFLAMQRAVSGLDIKVDFLLVDGNADPSINLPVRLVVKGDATSANIAAASILAKVSRDRFFINELDAKYPEYGFAKHKGYPTKAHYEALDKYGPCPVHRESFLKKWRAKQNG